MSVRPPGRLLKIYFLLGTRNPRKRKSVSRRRATLTHNPGRDAVGETSRLEGITAVDLGGYVASEVSVAGTR
jgi:hypothetical protein